MASALQGNNESALWKTLTFFPLVNHKKENKKNRREDAVVASSDGKYYIRMQNGSHLWQLALQKRKEGRCPLEPGEVAVILRAMGYPKETQIYVASGQVYGGQNRMAPLRNMFPNLVIPLPYPYISRVS